MIRLRYMLSSGKLWIGIAYLGIVALGALVFVLYGKTVKREATRQAIVARCLATRPQLANFSKHLRGVNLLADVLVTNSAAAVSATARSDPQWRVRFDNLQRSTRAQADISAVKRLPVPTIAQCKASQP